MHIIVASEQHIAPEPRAAVKDERAGLEAQAGHVEVAENRKPLNAFTFGATRGETG
jgi:hypothetical protein